jgi:hypothetical protein
MFNIQGLNRSEYWTLAQCPRASKEGGFRGTNAGSGNQEAVQGRKRLITKDEIKADMKAGLPETQGAIPWRSGLGSEIQLKV